VALMKSAEEVLISHKDSKSKIPIQVYFPTVRPVPPSRVCRLLNLVGCPSS